MIPAIFSLWPVTAGVGPAALQRAGRRKARAHRELAILERLGGQVSSPATALLLADALAGLITGATAAFNRGGARAKLDEV